MLICMKVYYIDVGEENRQVLQIIVSIDFILNR